MKNALKIAAWPLLLLPAFGAGAADYAERADVRAYIDELVMLHGFERDYLNGLFKGIKHVPSVLRLMDRQYEAQPWYKYRKLFVNEQRVKKGVAFWHDNAGLLARVEREYRVPSAIVLAIAGIETNYGVNLGRYPVLDSLTTLGFDYPRRARFFRAQLTEVLLLGREERLDLAGLRGSYTGAVGLSQFMPGSYRSYAVDFDGDNSRNLWRAPDALASIGNYLVRHGWSRGGAIADRVELQGKTDGLPFNKALKPWLSRADAEQYGIESVSELAESEPLFSIFEFELEDGAREHWATYHNFYVISRYNHSRRYSMAVYQLSELLKQRYAREGKGG